jgi:hypothetical protein
MEILSGHVERDGENENVHKIFKMGIFKGRHNLGGL